VLQLQPASIRVRVPLWNYSMGASGSTHWTRLTTYEYTTDATDELRQRSIAAARIRTTMGSED
jgi:hypothetical protein